MMAYRLTFSGFPPLGSMVKINVVSRSLRPVSALKRLILEACEEGATLDYSSKKVP